MLRKLSVTDAARNFADTINRVLYLGDRFVLVRGGREVAELAPVAVGRRLGELAELLAGLPVLAAGEGASFAADLAGSWAF